jgi:ribonucleoside-diphosphate reductase alpha chain
VHELVCKTARAIVSGGVRRSSLISLSDLEDKEVAVCKSAADWYDHKPHLACANNSAVFEGRGTEEEFFANWKLLADSKSGERGLFNRAAARNRAQRHGRRKHEGIAFGTNPCGEVRGVEFSEMS